MPTLSIFYGIVIQIYWYDHAPPHFHARYAEHEAQVRALADKVVEAAAAVGVKPLGVEGQEPGEWVLIDLGDVVVHTMQPATRDFYQLEKLWSEIGEALMKAK